MEHLKSIYNRHIRIIPGVQSYVLATIFIFVFGLSLTFVAWYTDHKRVDEKQRANTNLIADDFRDSITNHLGVYEQILRGSAGLINTVDELNTSKWDRYVGQYDLAHSYPGIGGIGYAEAVKADQLDSYIQKVQADYPDYHVWPTGARDEYALTTYITSVSTNAKVSLGYDILQDQERHASLITARDSGNITMTGKLTLINDKQVGRTDSPGFIMYEPVYAGPSLPQTVEARQQSIKGYVYASFRAQVFFDNVIHSLNRSQNLRAAVYDGSSPAKASLLFKTQNFDQERANTNGVVFQANVVGRPWTIVLMDTQNNASTINQRTFVILTSGFLLSVVVAALLFMVMFMRARDIVFVKQKEAQQAKDDLLSLASHQLRTPATAVKQYLGMILQGYMGEIDPKQQDALQKAYMSNDRQLEIINQILYVAKADAGRLSIHKSTFDINSLVHDIVLDMQEILEDRNQKVRVLTSQKKMIVDADEASIRMVVENLLTNASKYSHHGKKITIKTGVKDNELYISITDHGVGISPDEFDKLFKKFSRIDNELSIQVGGSGIGLYVDKVLIELHGGRIIVDSTIGKGSTFTVYLPASHHIDNNLTDDKQLGG